MTPAIAYGERVEAPPCSSLRDAIVGAVERIPGGHFIHAKAGAPRRYSTYQETLQKAATLSAGLLDRGMRPGDGLIINLRNSEDFIPTLWGSVLGGFVAVPLGQLLVGRSFGPEGPHEVLSFIRAALKRATLVTDNLGLSETAPLDSIFFDEFVYHARAARDVSGTAEARCDRLCLAIPTSGATGRPKMVGLSEGAVLARWWPKMPDAENAGAFLSWSPYDHVMGLGVVAPNLKQKVHLDAASFVADPLLWLDVIEETRATHATMTNFGLSLIIGAVETHPERSWRLDDVRKIGVGAEAISRTLCRRFFHLLAPFGLREDAIILGYGLTECGPVVGGSTAFSPDAAEPEDGRIFLDRPTAGHAVRVVGKDGQILNEDCVGAIEVRGPTMTSGYVGNKSETDRLFTSDGWLRTGDLGVLDKGRLAVIGREKELIVVNARKYSCQEIEEAITTRSRLTDVYAAPLERTDEARDRSRGKPFAIFVAVDNPGDLGLANIAAEVRGILASVYRFAPEAVALIDRRSVPRTPLGKVRRLELAARIGQPQFENHVHRLDLRPPPLSARRANGEIEQVVAASCSRLLHCPEDFDRDADFFALGGDSVLALQLSLSLEQKFGFAIPFEKFADRVSVREIANYVAGRRRAEPADDWAPLAPNSNRDFPALPDAIAARLHVFLKSWPGTPMIEGGFIRNVGTAQSGVPVFWCLQDEFEAGRVGAFVGQRRPAFAMRSGNFLLEYGTPAARALARRYADEIKAAFPNQSCVIAGNCQGAIVALDVARALLTEGRRVQALIIADTPPFELFQNTPFGAPVVAYLANRSKFNPYRKYRNPDQGLKKLLPAGLRTTIIPAAYTGIMEKDAFPQLAADLEQAVAWSEQMSTASRHAASGVYPNSAYRNRIFASVSELKLAPGEKVGLDLTLYNGGPTDWEPFELSGIAVGNHWLSPDGEMLIWSDGRTPLNQIIAAGSQGSSTLDITAPPVSGRYLMEVDLVEEGVRWFGEKASPPLHITVVVEEEPASDAESHELPATGATLSPEFNAGIGKMRSAIRASALPHWRKLLAKLALSLAKRASGGSRGGASRREMR